MQQKNKFKKKPPKPCYRGSFITAESAPYFHNSVVRNFDRQGNLGN